MLLWAVVFFGAAVVTVSMTLLIVSRMVRQLVEVVAPERRISSSFLDPRLIIREHNRLFPQSDLNAGFLALAHPPRYLLKRHGVEPGYGRWHPLDF